MLDFTKLSRQMQGMTKHLAQEAVVSRQRVNLARECLAQAEANLSQLVQVHQTWHDELAFLSAEPLEPLTTRHPIAIAPEQHTVIATDGSQIAPNHHEIAYCYLLNIGRVALHYGQNRAPWLDSIPEVFYRPEDLYVARQWGIRTEEWMGYRRTTQESIVLAEIATTLQDTTLVTESSNPSKIPQLAMVDGSLIYWFLESLPQEARHLILPGILESWDQLRDLQIPWVGYLSASRSVESLNFLRLSTCPHPEPHCSKHCPKGLDTAPCNRLSTLRDTTLWSTCLDPGERGTLWRSSARILNHYGDYSIYFCYLHVGTEIARVEFPAWVAEDSRLLDQSLSLVLAQVQKGYGYPVVLAEAHNQAVVRSGDRRRFFALLEQQMIQVGIQRIGTSYKEARKRGSIA